jgi:D-alanyl-lipoteichoic acid acyltransferase DltB (MBOAT superfamily)
MEQFGRKVYAPGWQRQFALGVTFIVIGLVQKVFIADPIGGIINPIYEQAARGAVPRGEAWLALGFTFQILFDFAGYSDIAIGLGLLFGVRLPYNFNAPLQASNLQELWQRWHMTLLAFLRDYFFQPITSWRITRGRLRLVQHFAAMALTMALCGLWHGASWTFVLWGTLHGIGLVIVSLYRRYGWRMPSLAGWALTISFALLSAVIFRATSLNAARHIYEGLAIVPNVSDLARAYPIWIAAFCALALPASQDIVEWLNARPRRLVGAMLGLAMVAVLVALGDRDVYEFVYFQF